MLLDVLGLYVVSIILSEEFPHIIDVLYTSEMLYCNVGNHGNMFIFVYG